LFLAPPKVVLDKSSAPPPTPEKQAEASPAKVGPKSSIPVLASSSAATPSKVGGTKTTTTTTSSPVPLASKAKVVSDAKAQKVPADNLQQIAKDMEVFTEQEGISRKELEELAGVSSEHKGLPIFWSLVDLSSDWF